MKPKQHELADSRILEIREAKEDDARELLDFVEGISVESEYLALGPGDFELTEDQEREFIRSSLDADNCLFLVGTIDGRIVGTLGFTGGRRPRLRHCGEFGVSVRKAFWGLGVGSRLLDAFIAWARGSGVVKKINLRVRTDNHRAIALYEKKGFELEGTIRKEVVVDGKFHDHHSMGFEC